MLLDQKRTKRIVQVVAILTSVAFAGVIFVVLGLVVAGGGSSGQGALVDEAKARVEAEPRNPDAWDQLASAHASAGELDEAIEAAQRASQLAPGDFRKVQNLVALQATNGDSEGAITTLQRFTRANPDEADAFLQLGTLADQAGRLPLARLSYQTYVRLAPDDPNADEVRSRLRELERGAGGARAPAPADGNTGG